MLFHVTEAVVLVIQQGKESRGRVPRLLRWEDTLFYSFTSSEMMKMSLGSLLVCCDF